MQDPFLPLHDLLSMAICVTKEHSAWSETKSAKGKIGESFIPTATRPTAHTPRRSERALLNT